MNNVILLGQSASIIRNKAIDIEKLESEYTIIDWIDDVKSNQLDQLSVICDISESLIDINNISNVLTKIANDASNLHKRINIEHKIYHTRSEYIRNKMGTIVGDINKYLDKLFSDFTPPVINDNSVKHDQRRINELRNRLIKIIENNSTYIDLKENLSSQELIEKLSKYYYNDIDQLDHIDRIKDPEEHTHIDNEDHYHDNKFIIFDDEYIINDNEVGMFINGAFQMITNFIPLTNKIIQSFNDYNIAPYGTIGIGIYNKDENGNPIGDYPNRVIAIPKYIKNFGKRLYRVGLCSDIHYNDEAKGDNDPTTRNNDDGTEYHTDTRNFLKFYQNKQEVEFICAAGDVGTNSINHDRNFKLMLNNYARNTPFFSCYGNHDYYAANKDSTYISDEGFELTTDNIHRRTYLWNKVIISQDPTFETHHYTNDMNSELYCNYWFERKIEGTNKSDIYFFLSIDYDNTSTGATHKLNYNDDEVKKLFNYVGELNTHSYTEQRYDFNLYNSGVFVFTHLFFPHKAGTYNGSATRPYSYGLDSVRITESWAYILCGAQFDFLNKLNNEYPNTIWFTGHSHYTWEWQLYDPNINICNFEREYVHPRDNDFNSNLRYSPKFKNVNINTPYKEIYYLNSQLHTNEKILFAQININDKHYLHNITIKGVCSSSYTSTYSDVYGGGNKDDVSSCYLYVENKSVHNDTYMRLHKEYFKLDERATYDAIHEMHEFEINCTLLSTAEILEIGIFKELGGSNWHTLNIFSIYDNDLNEYIYNEEFQTNISWYTETTENIKEPSQTVVPKNYRILPPIIKTNTGFNVHLPSACRPIPLGQTTYGIRGEDSEGAIMDVYEDYIDIRGIFFRHPHDHQEEDVTIDNKEYINKYYALAQYRIPVKAG